MIKQELVNWAQEHYGEESNKFVTHYNSYEPLLSEMKLYNSDEITEIIKQSFDNDGENTNIINSDNYDKPLLLTLERVSTEQLRLLRNDTVQIDSTAIKNIKNQVINIEKRTLIDTLGEFYNYKHRELCFKFLSKYNIEYDRDCSDKTLHEKVVGFLKENIIDDDERAGFTFSSMITSEIGIFENSLIDDYILRNLNGEYKVKVELSFTQRVINAIKKVIKTLWRIITFPFRLIGNLLGLTTVKKDE